MNNWHGRICLAISADFQVGAGGVQVGEWLRQLGAQAVQVGEKVVQPKTKIFCSGNLEAALLIYYLCTAKAKL